MDFAWCIASFFAVEVSFASSCVPVSFLWRLADPQRPPMLRCHAGKCHGFANGAQDCSKCFVMAIKSQKIAMQRWRALQRRLIVGMMSCLEVHAFEAPTSTQFLIPSLPSLFPTYFTRAGLPVRALGRGHPHPGVLNHDGGHMLAARRNHTPLLVNVQLKNSRNAPPRNGLRHKIQLAGSAEHKV